MRRGKDAAESAAAAAAAAKAETRGTRRQRHRFPPEIVREFGPETRPTRDLAAALASLFRRNDSQSILILWTRNSLSLLLHLFFLPCFFLQATNCCDSAICAASRYSSTDRVQVAVVGGGGGCGAGSEYDALLLVPSTVSWRSCKRGAAAASRRSISSAAEFLPDALLPLLFFLLFCSSSRCSIHEGRRLLQGARECALNGERADDDDGGSRSDRLRQSQSLSTLARV